MNDYEIEQRIDKPCVDCGVIITRDTLSHMSCDPTCLDCEALIDFGLVK